jgi:hypothetical protein
MSDRQSPVVVVKHDDGRFAGLMTAENIGELMLVQSALHGGRRRASHWARPGVAGSVARSL